MGVSINGGTPKIIHFNGIFPYKPSIAGYPHFMKPPYFYDYVIHYAPFFQPTAGVLVGKDNVENPQKGIRDGNPQK